MLIPAFFMILAVGWVLDHLFVEEADDHEKNYATPGSMAASPAHAFPMGNVASVAPAGGLVVDIPRRPSGPKVKPVPPEAQTHVAPRAVPSPAKAQATGKPQATAKPQAAPKPGAVTPPRPGIVPPRPGIVPPRPAQSQPQPQQKQPPLPQQPKRPPATQEGA
jgi:hypothetical protein